MLCSTSEQGQDLGLFDQKRYLGSVRLLVDGIAQEKRRSSYSYLLKRDERTE